MGEEIVKVLLYVYPRIDEISEAVAAGIENRAVLSFRNPESTLEVCEGIAGEIFLRAALDEAKDAVKSVLPKLSKEELRLLECKYFKPKKKNGVAAEYSRRTYFRRQKAVLGKMTSLLAADGKTDEWFFENFSECSFMMRALSAVREGKDSILARTAGRGRRKNQTKSPASRVFGFLPNSTNAATPTAATAPRQIKTI